jgi:rhamnosyltransferase
MLCENVAAIVVTFNPEIKDFEVFLNCLKIQFKTIVIVDNFSDNLNEIEKLHDGLCNNNSKIIKNNSNLGLAFAQNLGVSYLDRSNFTAFCMFDQDSLIDESYLTSIVREYNKLVDSGNKIASLGPSIVDQHTNNIYPFPIYSGPFLHRKYLKSSETIKCSYIIASGSLTPLLAFQKIGNFMDKFFINYIDVEWCFRAKALGYDIFATNNVKLYQNVGLYRKLVFGRAIPVHSPLRRYYSSRNSIYMIKLPYVSIGYKIRELFFNPIRLVFDCIVAGQSLFRTKLFIKGIIEGILNKAQ